MKITYEQTYQTSLSEFGAQLVKLIKDQKYDEISNRFGYALAFDDPPADAIASHIASCLRGDNREAVLAKAGNPRILVKYFKQPNELLFFGLVECFLPLEHDDGELLAELIVSTNGDEFNLWLEHISYAAKWFDEYSGSKDQNP